MQIFAPSYRPLVSTLCKLGRLNSCFMDYCIHPWEVNWIQLLPPKCTNRQLCYLVIPIQIAVSVQLLSHSRQVSDSIFSAGIGNLFCSRGMHESTLQSSKVHVVLITPISDGNVLPLYIYYGRLSICVTLIEDCLFHWHY